MRKHIISKGHFMADKIKPRRCAEFSKQSANTERQLTNTAASDHAIERPKQSANDNSLTWPLIPFSDGWLSG
jgi:hypothetical protein